MSGVFVDTSALVKFYYPEEDSDKIEASILTSRLIYISNLSIVEMASALMKKVRNREIETTKELLIWNTLLDDLQTGHIEIISLDERHYFRASDIIREYGTDYAIRTLDALQLAAAQSVGDIRFLCTDKALLKIAGKMGIKTV